jgi:hypothetical protein
MKLQWSCDERNRKACRNSHGCHCREITTLIEGRATLTAALRKIADTDQYPDNEDTAPELREIARAAVAVSSPLRASEIRE